MPGRSLRPLLIILLVVVTSLVAMVVIALVTRHSGATALVATASVTTLPAEGAGSSPSTSLPISTKAAAPTTVTTEPVLPPGTVEGLPATLPASGPTVHVPILLYHHVKDPADPLTGFPVNLLIIRPSEFESQTAYLATHGIETINFRRLYQAMGGSAPLSGPCVLLTFDDGGEDLYTHAFPILKRKGLTATFFVITSIVGRPGYLTWEQLREMQSAGMSVESHTVNHRNLTAMSEEQLNAELLESKKVIEEQLGRAPVVLSYPGGAFDERVKKAARNAGYLMAVTTNEGSEAAPAHCFDLPRRAILPGYTLDRFVSGAD